MTDGLFKSAHQAITFALNFSDSAYDAPTMNRMAQEPGPPGRGLGGLDGAGQAGMILRELSLLRAVQRHILVARLAPRWFNTTGPNARKGEIRVNRVWQDSVAYLVEAAASSCQADKPLREALVIKYAGSKWSYVDMAADLGYHRDTVSKHYRSLAGAFRLEESKGWQIIEDQLVEARIVASGS